MVSWGPMVLGNGDRALGSLVVLGIPFGFFGFDSDFLMDGWIDG